MKGTQSSSMTKGGGGGGRKRNKKKVTIKEGSEGAQGEEAKDEIEDLAA